MLQALHTQEVHELVLAAQAGIEGDTPRQLAVEVQRRIAERQAAAEFPAPASPSARGKRAA